MATSDRQILPNSFIDCRSNPELFKALTAVRDDKIESEQYYVLDKEKGIYDEHGEYITLYKVGEFIKNPLSKFVSFVGHKATLAELQEHFKIEQ